MTGEEMERAIEFLLQSQANFDARLEQTNQQVAETSRQLQSYAETQSEFIQIVTRHIEAQAEINASLRESIHELKASHSDLAASHGDLAAAHSDLAASQRDLAASQRELTASQLRTDERLDRLAATVERFITEGRNGNSQR
ncbi:MAG TPA: hypothetical protein VN256_10035 [Pyrinomonadaceae bacterium]|nr:hypothetical protein [Pyrinomonadaceae bacterium]